MAAEIKSACPAPCRTFIIEAGHLTCQEVEIGGRRGSEMSDLN